MPEPGSSAIAAIALGSNLGDREAALRQAVSEIGSHGRISAVSGFLDTAPVGFLDQPRFLNGALLLETRLEPLKLLHSLLSIEQRMGRQRSQVPAKGPRIIDLDIIFFADLVTQTDELTLPHPAMHERLFVLQPLAEIASGWRHPLLGSTVAELLASVSLEPL